jgi:hypothetical protein
MSYDLFIKGRYSESQLRKIVADFLEIDANFIGNLYDLGPERDVNIDVDYLDGDFTTRLSVYKNDDLRPTLKEIDFAIDVSVNLKEIVMITYWDDNPFFWITIQPNGEIHKVQEIPNEREKFIQINQFLQEKLELEEIRPMLK